MVITVKEIGQRPFKARVTLTKLEPGTQVSPEFHAENLQWMLRVEKLPNFLRINLKCMLSENPVGKDYLCMACGYLIVFNGDEQHIATFYHRKFHLQNPYLLDKIRCESLSPDPHHQLQLELCLHVMDVDKLTPIKTISKLELPNRVMLGMVDKKLSQQRIVDRKVEIDKAVINHILGDDFGNELEVLLSGIKEFERVKPIFDILMQGLGFFKAHSCFERFNGELNVPGCPNLSISLTPIHNNRIEGADNSATSKENDDTKINENKSDS